jgi:hypothetical protein
VKLISNSTVEDPRYKLLFPPMFNSNIKGLYTYTNVHSISQSPTPRNVSDPGTFKYKYPPLWNSQNPPKRGASTIEKRNGGLMGSSDYRKLPRPKGTRSFGYHHTHPCPESPRN